jgi:alkylation response protein AidB-like acyl-CoA dehydrogenase
MGVSCPVPMAQHIKSFLRRFFSKKRLLAMNFEFSAEHQAFREEVREFMRTHVPPDLARRTYVGAHPPSVEDYRTWQRILYDKGWAAVHFPKEYGGTGWDALRKHIFAEELNRADALDYGWQALHMIGPVLLAFGSEAQKQRFIPPMLRGEHFWCQGFSEPGAGSDLANLRTRAELVGDEWVINGQKIWTSDAHYADWGFFLVRTDPNVKPQRGISMIMVPMNSAGITIRTIHSINGGTDLNEVFLDNVRVPAENLVGEPGQGWTHAKYLLEKERTASASLHANKRELEKAKEIASCEKIDNVRLIDTEDFAKKLARLEIELHALEWSVLRILAEEKTEENLDAIVSSLKIRGSELQQRISTLQMEALGTRGLRDFERADPEEVTNGSPSWPAYIPGRTANFLYWRASTIFGGAREVQKNIIAKLAFGL